MPCRPAGQTLYERSAGCDKHLGSSRSSAMRSAPARVYAVPVPESSFRFHSVSRSSMASETRRTHHQVTFAVLAAGVAAFALLQSLVTPVLPTLQASLHTPHNHVPW